MLFDVDGDNCAPATSMAFLPSFTGIDIGTLRRHIEARPSTWTIASAQEVAQKRERRWPLIR